MKKEKQKYAIILKCILANQNWEAITLKSKADDSVVQLKENTLKHKDF